MNITEMTLKEKLSLFTAITITLDTLIGEADMYSRTLLDSVNRIAYPDETYQPGQIPDATVDIMADLHSELHQSLLGEVKVINLGNDPDAKAFIESVMNAVGKQ